MNVYIVVDIEGISGVVKPEHQSVSGHLFNEGRRMMTEEINVCVKACKEAGVEKVYVADVHGGPDINALWLDLCEEADGYILGCGYNDPRRFPFVEECDAVILLGYHAMAGTEGAILHHTMDGTNIENYWINGMIAGETAVDAGIAGDYGKPVIMVSGDDKVCAEAKALMPWCVTAEVKKGITRNGGLLLPRAKAHALLREKTIEAIKNFPNTKPLVHDKPVTLRVEHTNRRPLPSTMQRPYMKVIDGRTFEVTGETMEEALYRLW
jgi:D-amino peptidase